MHLPAHFGKFRLMERIGGGRLSQVFRVGRRGATRAPSVALKRVNPALIGEDAFVQLVVREAGLLSRLEHDSLCACHEMGVVDGSAFLTLDLVDGCTLRALMRRLAQLEVRLTVSAVLALAYQLATVLDYLHRECPTPLVHLDLSPQNVMLTRDGQAKLIDFGIARFLDGHDPPPLGGKIAGTVGYMSPEQARGATTLDARADQFGLGILLWELLTGRRLFRGGNTSGTWKKMREGDIPTGSLGGDRPTPLVKVVARLLGPAPEDRYPHLGQVGAELSAGATQPLSGRRPLSALVSRLLADPSFDPYDVVTRPEREASAPEIPRGDFETDEYEEISIQVDFGAGTPGAQIRAAVPDPNEPPTSPFLETIPESRAGGVY
ncbi:MAG: serine/threonine protein kinase [Deltaproteobacteria bacterium]|nr:serine/threonine protein kinase [Deltaproteobacteria bacterium]